MRNIQSIAQLHELQNETFVYAAIVAVVIFCAAFLLANLTPYRGGNDRSYITRRIWLIISIAIGSIGFWLYNDLYVMDFIKKTAFQNQFSDTNMQYYNWRFACIKSYCNVCIPSLKVWFNSW